MNRKRSLISDTFKVKKRRLGTESCFGVQVNGKNSILQDVPLDTKGALQYLASLFPLKLFNDTLPPIVLKHQLYSIKQDRTLVDRQLNELKDQGEILMFQLGFDTDAFAVVFAQDYKVKALAAEAGRETLGTVQKFLETVLPSCMDLSFNKEKMLKFLFRDQEITELIKSGVLTVRDAGSWWLAIPNSGRFTKFFIQGRKAVLGMIKKSKYKEVLQTDLECRKMTSHVKLGIQYHIHDIIGAELVECVPTTSGNLLRLTDT
ncbi:serine/threonine-protein kinase 19-like [Acipenser oxyrinchus oxyrinchus]|uniref:Serine/threonine-protein kinase 19-like n=1 Tax=Acipenser oxyrinchus oxyrinchus TaxID=40147 RepID=A0AAD8G0B4_ACIOX|nr:serine/threonine-protein kinase 19-like [Acipenser oxyrinchus oxyrinchus]